MSFDPCRDPILKWPQTAELAVHEKIKFFKHGHVIYHLKDNFMLIKKLYYSKLWKWTQQKLWTLIWPYLARWYVKRKIFLKKFFKHGFVIYHWKENFKQVDESR